MPASNGLRNSILAVALLVLCTGVGMRAVQHTLEEVAAGLQSKDVKVRLKTIEILRDGGFPEAAGPLAAALADLDDGVKLAAMDAERALLTIPTNAQRKRIGFVIERRGDSSGPESIAEARLSLRPMRLPVEILSGLAGAMRSPNEHVKAEALQTFGLLAPMQGVDATDAMQKAVASGVDVLRRGAPDTQAMAAASLGAALADCGTDPRAERAQGSCGQAGTALIEAMNSKVPAVRRTAMVSLGELRYPNAFQALSDHLSYYQRGPDATAALEGLAGVGHPTSVDIFKRLLEDKSADANTRRLAIEGIGRAGTPDDLEDIERATHDERSNEVLLAMHFAMLRQLADAKADELVAAVRGTALRPLALKYLLELSPLIASRLTPFLASPQSEIRARVADVLGFSADPAAIASLQAAAKDADVEVAQAASRAIQRLQLLSRSSSASARP